MVKNYRKKIRERNKTGSKGKTKKQTQRKKTVTEEKEDGKKEGEIITGKEEKIKTEQEVKERQKKKD